MQISKRSVAREWLTFLGLLALGAISCFVLGYVSPSNFYFSDSFLDTHRTPGGYALRSPFDTFFNDAFGLKEFQTIVLWLLPYLVFTIIRSITWSIKILRTKAD